MKKQLDVTGTKEDIKKILEDGVANLLQKNKWVEYLQMKGGMMKNYSFNNLLLVFLSFPTATEVKGYREWQKLGRQVRRGEKAIKIIAPIIRKEKEGEKEVEEVKGFRTVSVFDISQTDPIKVTIGDQDINIDTFSHENINVDLMEFYENFKTQIPIKVYEYDDRIADGYYDSSTKVIGIKGSLSMEEKINTLFHECSHYFVDIQESQAALEKILTEDLQITGDNRNKHLYALEEVLVESVAFMQSHKLGIPIEPKDSFAYICSWSKAGNIAAIKAIRKLDTLIDRHLQKMQALTEKIIGEQKIGAAEEFLISLDEVM